MCVGADVAESYLQKRWYGEIGDQKCIMACLASGQVRENDNFVTQNHDFLSWQGITKNNVIMSLEIDLFSTEQKWLNAWINSYWMLRVWPQVMFVNLVFSNY